METTPLLPEPPGASPLTVRLPRCAATERGYAPEQVDALLASVRRRLEGAPASPGPGSPPAVTSAQVRTAVFDGVRGGYRTGAVDEVLDAAEDALAALERDVFVGANGHEAWQRHLEELTELLRGRLVRPRTQRFRRPARVRARGYSAAHVDVLCERLGDRLAGRAALTPAALRRAVFPPAHGELGYEEQQVDAFLDRAVQLLVALR